MVLKKTIIRGIVVDAGTAKNIKLSCLQSCKFMHPEHKELA